MKSFAAILSAISLITLLSVNVYAGDTYSGQAVKHSGQASVHGSAAVGHGVVGAAQLTSGAVAVPLYVVGSVGTASTYIADELMAAATAPVGEPLALTDETVTVGQSPDKALTVDKEDI